MIGKSMAEVLSGLDMRKVLTKSFRSALSKLVFAYERTNEDVRQQIMTILRTLEDANFVARIRELLLVMHNEIKTDKRGGDFELEGATDERILMLAGTFQGALHLRILNTVSFLFAVSEWLSG